MITDVHREHFWGEGEKPERGEAIRERGEPAVLRKLVDHLNAAAENVGDEAKRERIRGLIAEIPRCAIRYIDTRIQMWIVDHEPNRSNVASEAASKTRSLAHTRLVDSIRIAVRNTVESADGFALDRQTAELVGDSDDLALRARVADAAVDLVWDMLNAEEENERRARRAA
jgi:hypothetical protein